MAKKKKATKKKVKKLSNGGTKKKKTAPKTKADKFLERKLNKDPFKGRNKTYLA